MEIFSAYIPNDRRRALARNVLLPERGTGAALFADISGFTPLTEALTRTLGPRRGAEELTVHLNTVYQALIQEVERYAGSVIGFAGDAITCWFEHDDGWRAVTCALAMQGSIGQFAKIELAGGEPVALAVKIGIAHGQARRLLVGDPEIQLLDVLAGETLGRMAVAAQLARRGETVLAPEVVGNLRGKLGVREFRHQASFDEPFAVVEGCLAADPVPDWTEITELSQQAARAWLIRPVYDRLLAGQGEFLTELRPAVAVFVKFDGIDYDLDPAAGVKLNSYVNWVQRVTARYGGFLVDVAVGDKGSYLYACFGAPVAHENDGWRALTAAHEIVSPHAELAFVTSTRVGVSSGTMRTGAYGGLTRRTYGVLGDEVNLAARLMESAATGQVLVSGRLRRSAGEMFEWKELPPLRAKGKSEPVEVSALIGPVRKRAMRFGQAQYGLELVGRARESEAIQNILERAIAGQGQALCLSAEAGMGKSRLVAEAVRLASKLGFKSYTGECQSHGTHTSYLVWQSVWQELFDLDSSAPIQEQVLAIQNRLARIDPVLEARLPLLGAVLNLPIPDNEVTAPLEARLRKTSLESLLLECLRDMARQNPLLVILEDTHWMDALSRDLLDLLVRSISKEPVVFLFTQRPRERDHAQIQGFEHLPQFTDLELDAFTDQEAGRLIQLKLAQLFEFSGATPPVLAGRLIARAAGNPFYLEELLNFLKDEQVDFSNADAVESLELPASLHSLVLSRIDRLTETQQSALKIASVIGRLFPAAVVWGIRPDADPQSIAKDLEALCDASLTAIDRPEPELVYIFKHVVTQEVTYESLPFATRSKLHERIGLCLEAGAGQRLEQQVNILAFHFDRTQNLAKRRQYLRLAGEQAQANYANADAIVFYERVLALLDPTEQVAILLKLGKVRELTGEWKQAGACYQRAFEAAEATRDHLSKAHCQAAMGDLLRKQGMFGEATDWLGVARTAFEEIGSPAGVGQALHALGTVAAMQGKYPEAKTFYEQSLQLRQSLGEQAQIASLLSNLGIIARFSAQYDQARQLMEQSLEIRRQVGDRWAIANSLNNLGVLLRDIGELGRARELLEESLTLNRQVGDRWAIANTLSSLGEVAIDQRDWPAARSFLTESLNINMDLGDRTAVAFVLECFAVMSAGESDGARALGLAGAAASLREEIGSPLSPAEQQRLDKNLESIRSTIEPEKAREVYEQGKSLSLDQAIARAVQVP